MRLTQDEQHKIIQAISPFLQNISAELFLFGSRTDDTKRGGDIDLLIILEEPKTWDIDKTFNQKLKIITALYTTLGEQKIDLHIIYRNEMVSHPFYQSIYSHALQLYQWKGDNYVH
jgi:predicted nucleotidyltransferase